MQRSHGGLRWGFVVGVVIVGWLASAAVASAAVRNAVSAFRPARRPALLAVLVALFVVALPGSAVAAAPTYDWTQQTTADSPPARYLASMAFDPATGEIVLFGGADDSGFHNDTWTYDGTNWTQQTTADSPSARYGASMAFDPATGKIVLFGGRGGSFHNDTWTYDGTNWTQQTTADSPPVRYGGSMAFDPATGKLVLFGGRGGISRNDTWTYDGANWTQQTTATSPPVRYGASMAFDPATGKLVLFGGSGDSGFLADTWTYDGTDWTQQTTATSPPARYYASMTFDPAIGELVLFGGLGGSNDTWTYDGIDWTQQTTATSPPARYGASMAFDPATGKIVLFGGVDGASFSNDTWTYGPPASAVVDWTQQSPASSPPARNGASMAFDPATGKIVLFGGRDDSGFRNDTWTYDGTNWTQQTTADSPPARYGASMAFDPATGELVLFGGGDNSGPRNDTWTYDGTNWTQQTTATSPPARYGAAMAFDSATGKIVLFGGDSNSSPRFLNDTWTYDGTNWTQQTTATSPPTRYGASMAFDSATGKIVLFGGYNDSGFFSDTWTYDGTNWTQQTTATSPPARFDASMAFDPSTGKIVLFGGYGGFGPRNDTWTYDGTNWTQQTTATSPPARYGASMAFDSATGKIVLFGGDSGSYRNDTWTYGFVAPAGNHAPAGTDKTVTSSEDTPYTFAASDFGFSDPNDSPANNLSSVKVTTLPAAGTLKLDGTAVNAGDFVSAADLAANKLTYDPAANACGAGYASFTFQVQDDGGTANSGVDTDQSPNTITINVNCVNDAPTNIALTNNSVAENTPQGTDVGDLSSTDPDAAQTHTYTLVTGSGDTDNNDFQITGNTLEVKNPLDFEAGATRTVRIRTTDSGSPAESFERSFSITVTDVNESPTNIALTNNSVAENAPQGTDVGDLSSTDPDAAQTHTYTLVTGSGDTDNNDFQITGNTLEVKNPLDFEAGATRTVRIRTTDSGSPAESFEKSFSITVTDVNESPTNIALTNNSVAENTPQGTDVGDLSSTDPDAAQTHTYTLVTGSGDTDNNDFQITGNTLEVKNPLDFEAGATRTVRIRTTDSGSPAEASRSPSRSRSPMSMSRRPTSR